MSRRLRVGTPVAVAVGVSMAVYLLLAGTSAEDWGNASPTSTPTPGTSSAAPTPEPAAGYQVVDERPDVDGYERDCGKGAACVFGPAWSDDVDVELGHDGCDTRNNMLQLQLREISIKPGTGDCVVAAGTLNDPYTGQVVEFVRGQGNTVSIDHIVPLAAAWDHGAHAWTEQQRRNFANDPRNLQATTWSVNSSKGDQTPGEWVPANRAGACSYAERYVDVVTAYGLTVSQTDHQALELLEQECA